MNKIKDIISSDNLGNINNNIKDIISSNTLKYIKDLYKSSSKKRTITGIVLVLILLSYGIYMTVYRLKNRNNDYTDHREQLFTNKVIIGGVGIVPLIVMVAPYVSISIIIIFILLAIISKIVLLVYRYKAKTENEKLDYEFIHDLYFGDLGIVQIIIYIIIAISMIAIIFPTLYQNKDIILSTIQNIKNS